MIKLIRQIPKSSFLLISILIFIFGNFIFEYFHIEGLANIIVYSLIFVGTFFSIENKSKFAKWLLATGLILNLLIVFSSSKSVQVFVFLVSALIFSFITFVLISQIAKTKKVNREVLVEAINGYLLIGVVSVLLNSLVIILNNDAINFQSKPHLSDIIYYSYINLTSIGFGDIAPTGSLARKISIFTGLSAQLYLAIIIALIVGKVSNSKSK